ncbi:MAG: 50S ribosomal protein L30 [Deltaproteobacteria bacterium]|nr:50S ribosomal protein L30 [Deltaproteobacteria bacterium]
MAIKLRVTQVGSGIGRPPAQRRTLLGLGLTRRGRSKVLLDTPEIRGMIRKVQHLVRVEPVE